MNVNPAQPLVTPTPEQIAACMEEAADLVEIVIGGPADPDARAVAKIAVVLATRDAQLAGAHCLIRNFLRAWNENLTCADGPTGIHLDTYDAITPMFAFIRNTPGGTP
jgi:hypothetical protein